jgi:hypothetical protein
MHNTAQISENAQFSVDWVIYKQRFANL